MASPGFDSRDPVATDYPESMHAFGSGNPMNGIQSPSDAS